MDEYDNNTIEYNTIESSTTVHCNVAYNVVEVEVGVRYWEGRRVGNISKTLYVVSYDRGHGNIRYTVYGVPCTVYGVRYTV